MSQHERIAHKPFVVLLKGDGRHVLQLVEVQGGRGAGVDGCAGLILGGKVPWKRQIGDGVTGQAPH